MRYCTDEGDYGKLRPLPKVIRGIVVRCGSKEAKCSLICAECRILELREGRTSRSCLLTRCRSELIQVILSYTNLSSRTMRTYRQCCIVSCYIQCGSSPQARIICCWYKPITLGHCWRNRLRWSDYSAYSCGSQNPRRHLRGLRNVAGAG